MSAFIDWAGAGVPVVCLSGIGGAAHLWAGTARAFAGRRVLAWNQPGYGGRALIDPLDFAGLAETLAADLDAPVVDLVGHSMGGMIALEFALRFPGRVRRLGGAGRGLPPRRLARRARGDAQQRHPAAL